MGVILAGLLAAIAPQAHQSQIVWKWQPDYTHCVLRQDLGSGRFLEVSSSPATDQSGLAIVESGPKARTWKPLKAAEVTFAPGEAITLDGFIGPSEDPAGRSVSVLLSRDDLVRFSSANALILSHAAFGTLRAPVQSPATAVSLLRACEDQRMKKWGVDPVAWRALSVKPTPKTPMSTWISWVDYPDREKIYKDDITVVARLDIGADGSIQDCTVVNQPPVEYANAACRALRRNARIEPAQDAAGRAVPAPFVMQIRFGAIHL